MMGAIGCSFVAAEASPPRKRITRVFAPKGTSLPEMVAAIGAGFHIEEDFENGRRPRTGSL
jgi:hypothetical protein